MENEITLERMQRDLAEWLVSPVRRGQLDGERYYDGNHDILDRKRTIIGKDGKIETVDNLPNNRIVDNRYKLLLKQKTNYLIGKPMTIASDDKQYADKLRDIFDKKFQRTLKNTVISAMKNGVSWLYPYYDSMGKLRFKLLPGYQVMPYWADDEHTEAKCAVRYYSETVYNGTEKKQVFKAEVYDKSGVSRYIVQNTSFVPDGEKNHFPYAVSGSDNKGYNWEKVPLIPVKYNESEMPLLGLIRSLQDGLNELISDFENNMQEDARNTILVLKNLDGQSLSEFRKNLATFGAVKVRSDSEARGGVDSLQITVNADNYQTILDLFKKAIIENGMGYDGKDDRLSGNPNQLNIRSMYSDIDLDANDAETELQAALDDLLWFADLYLLNGGKGSYFDTNAEFIFNRDILINESQVIEDIKNSVGILSKKTLVEQHPYITDVDDEMKRIKEDEQEEKESVGNYDPFPKKEE